MIEMIQREQYTRLFTIGGIHGIIAGLILMAVQVALYTEHLDFGRYQGVNATDLEQVGPRLQYVLQNATPGVVWLLFSLYIVIGKRMISPALDPGAGYEHTIQLSKNIIQNSLEQFVLSVVSQLILVTYLEPKNILNIIPTLSLLFLIGRIAFWLGYPLKRGLGFFLGFWPIVATIAYIGYRYVAIYF